MSNRILLFLFSLLVLFTIVVSEPVVVEDGVDSSLIEQFSQTLAEHEEQEVETDAAMRNEDMILLEDEEANVDELESEAESETETEAEEAIEEDISALEVGEDDDDEKPEHPTYVLPYPPVLPGHYTPLFNPYTNVNPLSTPFANYAATPGAHPGVAAAAAAQAGALAAVNGQIAGAAGGYPYYPYAARHPVVAGQLTGNPVPFSGYAGWIHPQNLNSAAVGDNEPEEFPQFVEVATEETEDTGCVGCSFD